MKSKKVISFDKLCEEIIKMIKVFSPSMKDLKNSVERLLAKDIIIRDEKDKTIIKYKNWYKYIEFIRFLPILFHQNTTNFFNLQQHNSLHFLGHFQVHFESQKSSHWQLFQGYSKILQPLEVCCNPESQFSFKVSAKFHNYHIPLLDYYNLHKLKYVPMTTLTSHIHDLVNSFQEFVRFSIVCS